MAPTLGRTPDDITAVAYEHAVVNDLIAHTPDQPWWLAYLDTGAHDIVFPLAPTVSLYRDWQYVLVEAGPEQALSWRTGHMRGLGALRYHQDSPATAGGRGKAVGTPFQEGPNGPAG